MCHGQATYKEADHCDQGWQLQVWKAADSVSWCTAPGITRPEADEEASAKEMEDRGKEAYHCVAHPGMET